MTNQFTEVSGSIQGRQEKSLTAEKNKDQCVKNCLRVLKSPLNKELLALT